MFVNILSCCFSGWWWVWVGGVHREGRLHPLRGHRQTRVYRHRHGTAPTGEWHTVMTNTADEYGIKSVLLCVCFCELLTIVVSGSHWLCDYFCELWLLLFCVIVSMPLTMWLFHWTTHTQCDCFCEPLTMWLFLWATDNVIVSVNHWQCDCFCESLTMWLFMWTINNVIVYVNHWPCGCFSEPPTV